MLFPAALELDFPASWVRETNPVERFESHAGAVYYRSKAGRIGFDTSLLRSQTSPALPPRASEVAVRLGVEAHARPARTA